MTVGAGAPQAGLPEAAAAMEAHDFGAAGLAGADGAGGATAGDVLPLGKTGAGVLLLGAGEAAGFGAVVTVVRVGSSIGGGADAVPSFSTAAGSEGAISLSGTAAATASSGTAVGSG